MMNDQDRRFFSGNTLQQAIVMAASHFGVEPDQLDFRKIEKRHGFVKVPRKVVIEVDPTHPRRAPGTPPGGHDEGGGLEAPPAADAHRPPPATPPPPPSPPPPPRPPHRRDEPERPPRRERGDRDGRGQGGEGRRRRREGPPPAAAPPAAGEDEGELVELPERPRPLAERYPPATGPLADATRQALDRILEMAGLHVEAAILQGDERLEIELSGRENALLTAEEGELLLAIEHLLPRAIRGIAGESTAVRVDCESFHELREERLRSMAQRVAAEVRRTGQAKKLRPMSPADRRIVHLTVADEPGVTSQSDGEGYLKRVEVAPE